MRLKITSDCKLAVKDFFKSKKCLQTLLLIKTLKPFLLAILKQNLKRLQGNSKFDVCYFKVTLNAMAKKL